MRKLALFDSQHFWADLLTGTQIYIFCGPCPISGCHENYHVEITTSMPIVFRASAFFEVSVRRARRYLGVIFNDKGNAYTVCGLGVAQVMNFREP